MVHPQSCLICGLESAKYKFRCCQASFCSTQCFREHAECTATSSKPNFESNIHRTNNFDLNLAEEEILSDESYTRVREDIDIQSMISVSRLQAIISRVNHARDRRRAFRRFYASDSQFSNFVNKVDSVLKSCEQD